MSNLYKELAPVYEAMYQTFINYEEEYQLYSNLLKKYKKKQVVEIGCGTGNLVSYFLANGFDYIGLDLSEEMINIAQKKVPIGNFVQGDMCHFQLQNKVQSIIITARTISYLLENYIVNKAFSNICENLEEGGILCFDFIDANQFMPIVAESKEIIHTADFKNITYIRKSNWRLNFDYGMGFSWDSIYYKKEGKQSIEIGQDNSNLRTFTRNELKIFLELNGFKIKEMISRATYAFPTYVLVAEKINSPKKLKASTRL